MSYVDIDANELEITLTEKELIDMIAISVEIGRQKEVHGEYNSNIYIACENTNTDIKLGNKVLTKLPPIQI